MKTNSENENQNRDTTGLLTVKASYAVKSWNETTWEGEGHREAPAPKRTHAEVVYAYEGDMEGESRIHYLMNYNDEKSGQFVGLEHFHGRVHGRRGSFVMRHVGVFAGEMVEAEVTIQAGSAAGELKGMEGNARIHLVGEQASYPLQLECRLPA